MFFRRYTSADITTEAITSAFRYVPSDIKEKSFKGEIAALITVSGDGSFQADRAVKFVWDGILDGYLYSGESSVIESLKKAIASGSRKIVELMKHDKELEKKGINLSFAVAVIKDKTGYLGVFGEEELYLYKSSGFVNIGAVLAENKVTVASVALEDDDLVLLASPVLLSAFTDVVEPGVDSVELVSRMDSFSESLMGNQGVLVLSRNESLVKEETVNVSNMENDADIVEVIDEEVEEVVETPAEDVSTSEIKAKGSEALEKLSKTVSDLREKLHPALEKVSFAFSNLGGKVKDVVEDRYGRKIWYKRMLSKFSVFKLRGGPSAHGMKIDGYKISSLRSKRFATVGIVLLAILVIFGGVKLINSARASRELHREVEAVAAVVNTQLEIADRDISVDRGSAESAIFIAQEELKKLDGKDFSAPDLVRVNELKKKVQDLDDRLNKVKVLVEGQNLERFINTKLEIDNRSKPSDMTIYRDERMNEFLIIADSGSRAVYRVGLFNKSSVLTVSDSDGIITEPRHVNMGTEGIYVYDTRSGIVRSRFEGEGQASFTSLVGLSADDINVGGISNMAIFSNSDEVYLLSNSSTAVIKSARTGSGGYGLPYSFVTGGTLSSATDIFGDYSVYVLTDGDNGLERYSFNTGELVLNPVTIVGLSQGLQKPKYGYTGSSLDNYLYVFDETQKRILVFEKPNEAFGLIRHPNEMWLINQYVYRGDKDNMFSSVKSVVVDHAESNMYVLDGENVWKISLR